MARKLHRCSKCKQPANTLHKFKGFVLCDHCRHIDSFSPTNIFDFGSWVRPLVGLFTRHKSNARQSAPQIIKKV